MSWYLVTQCPGVKLLQFSSHQFCAVWCSVMVVAEENKATTEIMKSALRSKKAGQDNTSKASIKRDIALENLFIKLIKWVRQTWREPDELTVCESCIKWDLPEYCISAAEHQSSPAQMLSWPLIGWEWSRDPETSLRLVSSHTRLGGCSEAGVAGCWPIRGQEETASTYQRPASRGWRPLSEEGEVERMSHFCKDFIIIKTNLDLKTEVI